MKIVAFAVADKCMYVARLTVCNIVCSGKNKVVGVHECSTVISSYKWKEKLQ